MAEKTIVCQDCGEEFVFTESEQKFYSERGFQDPKRCKPCRDKRKARRRDSGGRGGWGGPGRY